MSDYDSRLIDYAHEYDYLIPGMYMPNYLNEISAVIKQDTGREFIWGDPAWPLYRVHTEKNDDGTFTHTVSREPL